MQLIKLSVFKNDDLVRDVVFKSGLNLILNSSFGESKTGNSVGKSTLSRLLDYIFMSSGEDIYTAPEFGKYIPEVYEFITENSIYVDLEFKGFDGKYYNVKRNLTPNKNEMIYFVNDEEVDKSDYLSLVEKKIFGLHNDKPTLRMLTHKFIRNTNDKMQKTTRFLHGNAKPDQYDQLYLFLFGFSGLDLLKSKAAINNKIKTKSKHLSAYRNPHKESTLQKMIAPLKVEEEDMKNKIINFDFKGSEEADVKKLLSIQSELTDVTLYYSEIMNRIEYLEKSIQRLKDNASSIDGVELSEIYEQAGVSINDKLRRSYNDLVLFHNKIILNKVSILQLDVERFNEEASIVKGEINSLHSQESDVFMKMKEPDALKSIAQIYNDQSVIREKIASVEALLNKILDTKETIELLEKSKDKVIQEISNNTQRLDTNVEVFNEYFGELSKFLYGDRYIFDLIFDEEKEKCLFDIVNISPNSTGGKKKGELTAFDFAYIDFIEDTRLKRPTFIVHDSIEDVDINQVYDIFLKASQLSGQYIVALLSDKISDEKFSKFKNSSTILELSETNKFFKI